MKFTPLTKSRKSSSRAPRSVRAKVAHTSHNKRRLEVFIPAPVLRAIGWQPGGKVKPEISSIGHLRLSTAHSGLTLAKYSPKSTTVRVTVTGDFICRGLCAKVRPVEHSGKRDQLIIKLPPEWVAA